MISRLFWRAYYLVRGRPSNLLCYIQYLQRTSKREPFQPYIYRNDSGKMWQIYLDDVSCYGRGTVGIRCEVLHCQETGRVVGLNIFDEELERIADTERRRKGE